MTNDVEICTQKWIVVLAWDLPQIINTTDPEYKTKREQQIRDVLKEISTITGFPQRNVLKVLRKAQNHGHAILRKSNVEVCERTYQALKERNIGCIMFPE